MANHVYIIYLCLLVSPEIYGSRTIKSEEAVIIFAKLTETVDVVCENGVPLKRCGFTHPNGTKIMFRNVLPGTSSCNYSISATTSDIGVWTCHFWTQTSPQEQMKKIVEVRLAHTFAALDREIRVREGEEASLSCLSTERMVPLSYCHFITPQIESIHMDDGITSQHALMRRYFFPRNKSLHRGDCGVSINSALSGDSGVWSCHGRLESDNRLFTDTIRLIVEDKYREVAVLAGGVLEDEPIKISLVTYVCGTLAFLCLFVALVYWKYRYYSEYYGKTWGDDDSIRSYVIRQHVNNTSLVLTSDYLLIT